MNEGKRAAQALINGEIEPSSIPVEIRKELEEMAFRNLPPNTSPIDKVDILRSYLQNNIPVMIQMVLDWIAKHPTGELFRDCLADRK